MDIKRRLFIGNLPSGVDENLIRNRFSKYGEVLGVELKQRKANDGSQNDEIISTFAFIDISAKKEKLDSCLKKLSRKKWDGQIIKIDFAKESVLSRLERERKELFSESKSNNKEINKGNSSSSTLLNGNSKWYGNSVRNGEKAEEEQKHEYQNNKRKLGIDFQQHNGKVRRFPESTNKNGDGVETNKTSSSSQSFTPEQRRLKSLEEKMKLVSDRKLAVKAALSSVDSGNRRNKIIFKDDDDNNEGDSVSSCIEPESSIHASKEYMTPEIPNLDSSNKEKNNLFDDSDDSDDETPNSRFKIKEHFDGKKGQKLLKLQSKYGNDSRFALDQRFAESSSDEDREEEEEDDEEETTRNETKSDAVDEDGDRMHVDDRDDEEVNRQLEILQNLVGHQIIKPRADDTKPKKQKPGASSRGSQLCVRFDPTIAEHEKFIVKPPPPGTEEETKASKKRKKTKSTEENVEDNDAEADKSEVETNNAVSAIEVSKETYYEVASDLKERLKSSGTGFSLSQLFSSDEKSKSNDENDRLLSSDQSKEKASTAIKPSIGFEKNDDTNYERMASQNKTSGLSNLWKESFFFKDNDDRFQEGADFFMKNNDDSNRNFRDRRQELKLIVKTKLKRVMRKDRMFKKKIGGGFPSKMNKFPKKKVGR